jgi:DNA-binding response OmpR family regulator
LKKPLISILDDEPEIRTLLSDVLQEAGFETQSFGRAATFEAALAKRTPDVCLVDLSLPDTDGLTVVHRLALEQGAVVIIISGRAQVQDRVTGLELGADDYISKPFDPAEVVARIRARLRSAAQGHRAVQATPPPSTAGPHISTATCSKTTPAPRPRSATLRARFCASSSTHPNASSAAPKCKAASAAPHRKVSTAPWTSASPACAPNCERTPKTRS